MRRDAVRPVDKFTLEIIILHFGKKRRISVCQTHNYNDLLDGEAISGSKVSCCLPNFRVTSGITGEKAEFTPIVQDTRDEYSCIFEFPTGISGPLILD